MPVTPYYPAVCGVLAYKTISDLPIVPDIAILCTHASRNVSLFKQLAEKGVKQVIVLSSDMYSLDAQGEEIQAQCMTIAKSVNMRILGPNSLGLILPWMQFNGSFSPVSALKGNIAFVSQSAAVCTTILDWANDKGIGFSAFISLGNASDIDFADLLDTLSTDKHTDAILLYVDTIRDARRFMSAARAASRNRRILVLKGGRTKAGRKAAQMHTGGDDTLDIIYDSAIRRTGMLRVNNTHELFAAVETLTHSVPLRGERLAIITNGGGPAIMAVDALLERGGKLAQLEDEIYEKLNQSLPQSWSHSNPVDIVGDADHLRYVSTLNILLESENIDAILIMHSPSAIAHSEQTAQALVEAVQKHPRAKRFNILTNWSGELSAKPARTLFNQAGIPTYRTPESAVTAFMHLVEYRRNQKHLMETPTTTEVVHASEMQTAKSWIHEHLGEHDQVNLDTHQIGTLLKCFNFNVLPTWIASDSTEAVHIAETIGYPVAVKLRSPDIAHKSDVQGVMLNLRNRIEVANAALPPLNMTLARYLIVRAIRSGKIRLQKLPVPIDIEGLSEFLVRISQMVVECPQVHELDIHPLLVNGSQFTILDANLVLRQFTGDAQSRLAIRPYPTELEERCQARDGEWLTVRPILPEDEPKHAAFIKKVSKEDLYKRFFSDVGEFNHEALANLTQIDFDREMAFVAVSGEGEDSEIIGVSRALINHENTDAEFAILIRSDLKGKGLGKILMRKIIDYCKAKGTQQMSGMTMPTNRGMLTLAQKMGFAVDIHFEDGTADMVLPLR